MDVLYNEQGVKLTTTIDIQAEVMHFYTGLLGTDAHNLLGVDIALVIAAYQEKLTH